ncbi:MAG: enoyl-CoA hydratase/isomerase family protein, partial [Planctomycetota bacterium]
ELHRYFTALEQASLTRIVVLAAQGPSFCAGLDLKEIGTRIETMDSAAIWAEQRALSRLILAMRRCPQPIVCLLQGSASGGGFALALACDIRIATSDARMNAAFIQVGLTGCDVGVSYHLPQMVGSSVAAELMMTGRFLSAERAYTLGLVSEIVTRAQLMAAGERLTEELLLAAPMALELTKLGLSTALGVDRLEAAVEIEDRQQALMANSIEFKARIRGFLAKMLSRA